MTRISPIRHLLSTAVRFLAFVTLIIAGCGDGNDVPVEMNEDPGPEMNDGPDPQRLTGYLSASATSGVSYETATQSGVTSENGEFVYREGESVRFFLGDTTLGEVAGQAEVTPFDLAGTEPLTTGYRGFLEARADVSRAANIATLLQTLDYDSDPSNGVEITSEVAALFDGVDVDLERDIFVFARERTFRSVLNRANEDELLDDYRRPRGGIAVMDDLYEELGISAGFFAPLVEGFDDDGDGTEDRLHEYAFEAQSSKTLRTNRGPNTSRTSISREFDEDGKPISSVQEVLPATLISSERSEFDQDGNLLSVSLDLSDDGHIDDTKRYSYDEYGEVLRFEHDERADGTVDAVIIYEYDARGNRQRVERDIDADGVIDRVEAFTWSEQREIVRSETDEDGDGIVDRVVVYEYDEAGHLVGRASFRDGSQNPSNIELWEYDESGLETRTSEDEDADGIPDTIAYSTYDDDGLIVLWQLDLGGDGVIDRVVTRVRDTNGYETRLTIDRGNDGTVDYAETYELDANGNRTREELDHDGDGTPEQVIRRAFAPTGWGYLFYELRDRFAR